MTDFFSCPCGFVSDSPSCARYRIVLRQVCILQTSEDIFKTLNTYITGSHFFGNALQRSL